MALLAWLFLTLIYIQLFKISLLALIIPFVLFGMPIGLGLSWLFFYQLGAKKKISAQVFSSSFVLGNDCMMSPVSCAGYDSQCLCQCS